MRPADDGARHRADHLECDGRRDRQRCCILQRPRLRRLARTGTTADIDGRPYHPRQDIQARQSLSALSVVQAAWVVLVRVGPKHWDRYGLKSWIEAAKKRLHHNVLAIELAHKLARIAWAVLHKGRAFECVKTNEAASRPA